MSEVVRKYESVVVSSRIRLARNFVDYPFPPRLIVDKHAVEQSREIVQIVSEALRALDFFKFYDMQTISNEEAEFFLEKNLISRDLMNHRKISAALLDCDESISVMINEEDHIREQCFTKGYDLRWAYEKLSGIDDTISETIPFAYDEQFGYLTACPSNLGTGLRASVMLFLPAISRRSLMPRIARELRERGLTVRGSRGEGSESVGEMFQVSNEMTLGIAEDDILDCVEKAVRLVVEFELRERERMKIEEGVYLQDRVMRSYGILANCRMIGQEEFINLTADLKLGLALGYFETAFGEEEKHMAELDELIVEARPANLNRINGAPMSEKEQDAFRAELTRKKIITTIKG